MVYYCFYNGRGEQSIDMYCRRQYIVEGIARLILVATIDGWYCRSRGIFEENRSSTASIDGHCQPQWIVRDVYRWPLPAAIDCASYPSISIVALSLMGKSIDIYCLWQWIVEGIDRQILSATIDLWWLRLIDIVEHNALSTASIDGHCQPQ